MGRIGCVRIHHWGVWQHLILDVDDVQVLALIPARSGSKRIPHKNVKPLGGVPLMCWTIAVARKSRLFSRVVVSTDSIDYCKIATAWDADAILRPAEMATDTATDFDWIKHALDTVMPAEDSFALLRPTAPFRTVDELKRAQEWLWDSGADSIRAVEKAKQHPYKMWVVHGDRMTQLMPLWDINIMQTQSMPVVHWANASLEMAWSRVIDGGTYSGREIAPFYTKGLEGFDINSLEDWGVAERIVASGIVEIPK